MRFVTAEVSRVVSLYRLTAATPELRPFRHGDQGTCTLRAITERMFFVKTFACRLATMSLLCCCALAAQQVPPGITTSQGIRLVDPIFRPYRNVHFFPIGINRYPLASWDTLQAAENDAAELAALLESRFGYKVSRPLLLGPRATKQAILQRLNKYKEELSEDDSLIIFFAGHGVIAGPEGRKRGFFVPVDASVSPQQDKDDGPWRKQALEMLDFVRFAGGISARHVLLLLDTCFSGFVGARSPIRPGRLDLRTLMSQKSRLVITAGIGDQRAFEGGITDSRTLIRNGWFTSALLEILRSTRAISARELHIEIRKRVMALSKSAMQPGLYVAPEWNGEFVFVPRDQDPSDQSLWTRVTDFIFRGGATLGPADFYDVLLAEDYRYTSSPEETRVRWLERLKQFEDGAAHGNAFATAALSVAHAKGVIVEKDPTQAIQWARAAVHVGRSAVGLFALAHCYRDGIGVDQNPSQAQVLLGESAAAGFAPAVTEQAIVTLQANKNLAVENKVEFTRILKALESASAQGYAVATYVLASLHNGQTPGMALNGKRAAELLTPIAEHGFAQAQFDLYVICKEGFAGDRNLPVALKWLRKAADAGHAGALAELGALLSNKPLRAELQPPLAFDPAKAVSLLERAAKQNEPRAHFELHELFKRGEGLPPDFARSRQHLEAAAKLGLPSAIRTQAVEFFLGLRLYPKDEGKAVQLMQQAATLGDSAAQYLLGTYASAGVGPFRGFSHLERNLRAVYWYIAAAKAGMDEARRALPNSCFEAFNSDWAIDSISTMLQAIKRRFPESTLTADDLRTTGCLP